jgi:hypothetical protein
VIDLVFPSSTDSMYHTKNNKNRPRGKSDKLPAHRQLATFGVSESHFVAMITIAGVFSAGYKRGLKTETSIKSICSRQVVLGC